MLMAVLNAVYDSVNQILKLADQLIVCLRVCTLYVSNRKNVEKRSLFEHMDALLLVLDEVVDGG